MTAAIIFAVLGGLLLAPLISKSIRLQLWLDVVAGIGALVATWVAATLAGGVGWPLWGLAAGFGLGIAYLKTRSS